MKKLICDKCNAEGKEVKTYTYTSKFMSVKMELPHLFSSDGIYAKVLLEKEFCDNCAANIHASYKHFLEEHIL